MTRTQAAEQLRKMTFMECINLWNEMTSDHMRTFEIHEMHDDEWWDYLKGEIDGYWFMRHLLESGQTFNITDRFFFYDSEIKQFFSFSTKQELVEQVGEDTFIEELINR